MSLLQSWHHRCCASKASDVMLQLGTILEWGTEHEYGLSCLSRAANDYRALVPIKFNPNCYIWYNFFPRFILNLCRFVCTMHRVTSRYRMPLLHIIGNAAFKKTFTVDSVFLTTQRFGNYLRIIQVKTLSKLYASFAPNPVLKYIWTTFSFILMNFMSKAKQYCNLGHDQDLYKSSCTV